MEMCYGSCLYHECRNVKCVGANRLINNDDNKINGNFSGVHRVALSSSVPGGIGIWQCWFLCILRVAVRLVFVEGGKLNGSTWRKILRGRDNNEQQTQPTYGVMNTGNRTRATLVGVSALTTPPSLLPHAR